MPGSQWPPGYREVPSRFRLPAIRPGTEEIARHFAGRSRPPQPLRNPHHERKPDVVARRRATPAAVLLPIVDRRPEPTLLVTRRDPAISYAGHWAFPGGRSDPEDVSAEATALRETEEEIGLARDRVRVLGRLGHYVTQSGFGITPIVGLVSLPFRVRPRPGEVDEIVEIPLHHALDASRYALHQHPGSIRAHYHLFWEEVVLGGPTVAVLMGLYEELFRGKATR